MADEPLTECQECGAPAVRVLHSRRGPLQGLRLLQHRLRQEEGRRQRRRLLGGLGGVEGSSSDSKLLGLEVRSKSDSKSCDSKSGESKAKPPEPPTEPQPFRNRFTAFCRTDSGTSMLPPGPSPQPSRAAAEHVGGGAAADPGGEDQLRHREEAHVADERFRRVPADDRALDEVVGDAEGVGEAALDAVDHGLLGLLAVEVVVAERCRRSCRGRGIRSARGCASRRAPFPRRGCSRPCAGAA